jgi:hypothetical protein
VAEQVGGDDLEVLSVRWYRLVFSAALSATSLIEANAG